MPCIAFSFICLLNQGQQEGEGKWKQAKEGQERVVTLNPLDDDWVLCMFRLLEYL